jgi:hypothetical protein
MSACLRGLLGLQSLSTYVCVCVCVSNQTVHRCHLARPPCSIANASFDVDFLEVPATFT